MTQQTNDRFSILWEKEIGVVTREEKSKGCDVIRDLQLDRAFRTICPDTIYRNAFLDIAAVPSKNVCEIKKRSEVIKEFAKTPAMLDKLTELIRHLLMTKTMWETERSRISSAKRANPNDKSLILWNSREQLVLTAHYIRIVFVCLRDIHETLNMMGASSEYLRRLMESTRKIACTNDSEKLLKLAADIERGLLNAHTYELEFVINREMRRSPDFLYSFNSVQYAANGAKAQKKTKNSIFSLFDKSNKNEKSIGSESKNMPEPEPKTPLAGIDSEQSLDYAAKAVNELNRYLTSLLRTVYDRYSALENELYFCKAALFYINRFSDRHVIYTYPEIIPAENSIINITELSDLLLLTESMNVSSVVPNDVTIVKQQDSAGMLVTGKNNSGKTVYLRSVGTAVLLAQCGLPIPAKTAEISVRNRIFTSFAKAEGELVPLSSAGRFEEEVAELYGIISEIEDNSLLLLNETFQTTSYDEGAVGMYDILSYVSALGCGFIFVTHLTKLVEMYKNEDGVTIMKTSDDPRTKYKISKIN